MIPESASLGERRRALLAHAGRQLRYDIELALAAYNCGEKPVRRVMKIPAIEENPRLREAGHALLLALWRKTRYSH